MAGLAAEPPAEKTGKSVAIVGAGPAGMAAAQQLARQGHDVHVYENMPKLVAFCAMAFPISKWKTPHRPPLSSWKPKALPSITTPMWASTCRPSNLHHDALIICGGSEVPRDLPVEGRGLTVHFAMDFLPK